jgi:hypothetical protein
MVLQNVILMIALTGRLYSKPKIYSQGPPVKKGWKGLSTKSQFQRGEPCHD